MRAAIAAPLLLLPAAAQVPGYSRWPPPGFERGLHKTADGTLHYVAVGRPTAAQCVLMLHGNPRSTDEFTDMMQSKVCTGRYCIAVDFFGSGHSDDPRRDNITLLEYAGHMKGLLGSLGITRCNIFGSYTGATLGAVMATEYPAMVDYAVFNGLIYDSGPKTVNDVNHYVGICQHFTPAEDGSHLIDAWEQRSYAPDPATNNVWLKERTKLDFIRALPTQWPIMQANLDVVRYDGGSLMSRMAAFKKPSLLLYGTEMVRQWNNCPPCWNMTKNIAELVAAMNKTAMPPTVKYIEGATEVALNENASWVEGTVSAWLPPV